MEPENQDENAAATAADDSSTDQNIDQGNQPSDEELLAAGYSHATTGSALPVFAPSTETEDDDATAPTATGDAGATAPAGDAHDEDGTDASAPVDPFNDAQREYIQRLLDEQTARANEEIRKLHGRYGQLQGHMKTLQGTVTQASIDQLKELGYDEIADALALGMATETSDASANADDEQQPPVNDTDDDAVRRAHEEWTERYLNRLAPGWVDKVQSDDWSAWLATMDQAQAEAINDEADPDRFIENVAKFDTWTASRKKAADDKRRREQHLDSTEPATTAAKPAPGQPVLTEDQLLEQGFANVRGG